MTTTFCPACGMNQPSVERVQGSTRQWACGTCGLVLKEEVVAPASLDPVVAKVAVRKVSQAELEATRAAELRQVAKAAAEKVAAEALAAARAAKAAAAARGEARHAATGGTDFEPPSPGAGRDDGPKGIDFDDQGGDDFEIEMGGEVKVVSGRGAAPAPAAAGASSADASPFDQMLDSALDEALPAQPQARPPHEPAPAPPAQRSQPGPAMFDRVVVAEGAALLREITRDALSSAGLARHVRTCPSAVEMLQLVAESLSAGVLVDLAIIDIDLPVLGGHSAAIALRAFEKGLKTRPTPIIFFTALPCDDRLKKVLDHCQPARYLNKGTDGAPERIAARLVQVLSGLRR